LTQDACDINIGERSDWRLILERLALFKIQKSLALMLEVALKI
jgi:hypothetical protein